MKNKLTLLFLSSILLIGTLFIINNNKEKQEALILLEIPNKDSVNIVTLSDRDVLNRHSIISQYNNIGQKPYFMI